jgi:tRNA A37 methylthiotransferase MiaB
LKKYYNEYFKYIITSAKSKYKDKLLIVEGCDVCEIKPDYIKEQPVIIVGTSRLQSLFRRIKRENEEHSDRSFLSNAIKILRKYN